MPTNNNPVILSGVRTPFGKFGGSLISLSAVELGAIITGDSPGRTSAEAITLFKSVGVALEDVAVAGLIYAQARERDLGSELAFLS